MFNRKHRTMCSFLSVFTKKCAGSNIHEYNAKMLVRIGVNLTRQLKTARGHIGLMPPPQHVCKLIGSPALFPPADEFMLARDIIGTTEHGDISTAHSRGGINRRQLDANQIVDYFYKLDR